MSDKTFDFDKLDEEIKMAFSSNFTDEEIEAAQDNYLMEFGNMFQDESGLSVILWIDEGNRDNKHSPYRIKFQNNYSDKARESEMIPVSISENPEILLKNEQLSKVNIKIAKEVFEFVKKYHNELRDVVDQNLRFRDFIKLVKDKEQLNG